LRDLVWLENFLNRFSTLFYWSSWWYTCCYGIEYNGLNIWWNMGR
jgi:hypothetical protein